MTAVALRRTPGQTPALPGAVVVPAPQALVVTSGLVAPSALAAMGDPSAAEVPVDLQVREVLDLLLQVLADAGTGPEHVVKVEAFLADARSFPSWDTAYLEVWPTPGPARTTLVSGMADAAIAIEVQAIAHAP